MLRGCHGVVTAPVGAIHGAVAESDQPLRARAVSSSGRRGAEITLEEFSLSLSPGRVRPPAVPARQRVAVVEEGEVGLCGVGHPVGVSELEAVPEVVREVVCGHGESFCVAKAVVDGFVVAL